MDLTKCELPDEIHVPSQRVNDIINGRHRVSPSIVLRLGKILNMSAAF